MGNSEYLLSSVANTLKILDVLGENEELSIGEICTKTGFGKSSVFRMLYTLESSNFIRKTASGKYTLGFKFAAYGYFVASNLNIRQVCKPFMIALRDACGETVQLSILNDSGKVMFISKELGNHNILPNISIWEEKEAYSMSCGKTLLANIQRSTMLKYVEGYNLVQLTPNTITDKAVLLEQLERIRINGYAEDLEESEPNLVCFSAPIFNFERSCVAALSVSGPANRMYPKRDSLIEAVKATARDISTALGYN